MRPPSKLAAGPYPAEAARNPTRARVTGHWATPRATRRRFATGSRNATGRQAATRPTKTSLAVPPALGSRDGGRLRQTAMSIPFRVEIEEVGGGVRSFNLSGELDHATAPELREPLESAIEAGARAILVDLTDCNF